MLTDLLENKSKEFIFRPDGTGRYFCTNFKTALTPADLADVLGYSIPEYCQFLRIRDTCNNVGFEYRLNGSIIRINIYKLSNYVYSKNRN